jgi:anti-sigma factor RsiW
MTDPHLPPDAEHGPHNLTCQQILMDLLQRYLARETDADVTAEIDRHMDLCPPCVQFVADYRSTAEAVRTLRMEDVPPELTERLRELVKRESRKPS